MTDRNVLDVIYALAIKHRMDEVRPGEDHDDDILCCASLLMFVVVGEKTTVIISPKRSTPYSKSSKMGSSQIPI